MTIGISFIIVNMHKKASIPFKFKFCLKLLHGTAFPLQETALLFYASLPHEKASIPFKFKFCLKLLHGTAFPLQETALLFYASLPHLPSPSPPPSPKKKR